MKNLNGKTSKTTNNGRDFAKKVYAEDIIWADDPEYVEYYMGRKVVRGYDETSAPVGR
jgi:hypothetical protein